MWFENLTSKNGYSPIDRDFMVLITDPDHKPQKTILCSTATIVSHKTPWNAGYKANAAGKKVNFTYYSAFAAE